MSATDAGDNPRTWHYGLVAEWWASAEARPEEIAWYAQALRTYGTPALDLACGTGRILVPMLDHGFDVDGIDISDDMLEHCRRRAAAAGHAPTLLRQAMHELEPPRRYRTLYICDSFGIGGGRARDRETLRRVALALDDGGTLLISHDLPYDDERTWKRWLPGGRSDLPEEWPSDRGGASGGEGEEIELQSRLEALDPVEQRMTLGMRATRWRDGEVVAREERRIDIALYFRRELEDLLLGAGFSSVAVEGYYTGRPATADDASVLFIARR